MKTKVLRTVLLALSLLAGCAASFAKPTSGYYSYTLDVSEGLSSNIVYNIVKWKDDCVWMATSQGIDRYDGFSVKYYSLFKDDIRMSDDGQKISISTDGVHYLWAFTDSGRIYRYDAEGDEFELFLALSDLGIHGILNQVTVLDGKMFACTSDGVLCIDVGERKLLNRALPGENVKCLVPYVDGRLFAGGSEGAVVTTYDLQVSERIRADRRIDVECIYVDPQQNRVFLGTDGRGLWKYEKGELIRIREGLERTIVRSIVRLDENTLLVGFDGAGVYQIGRNGTGLGLFATDLVPEGDLALRTSSVYSILVDGGEPPLRQDRGGRRPLRTLRRLMETMYEKVRAILAKQLRVDAAIVTLDAQIKKDLGADSLDILQLLMRLEDQYGITIPDKALATFNTVGDVVTYLEQEGTQI